ncbi:hypothetical protein P4V58_27600 [Bacillus wiedmannii]|uniref:hypothetical protein n=1 Tax=Bacillus wiedmannii TaxID=1890302 RepID=UPI002E232FF4|nr:hypothetical protein [Bacillus wiedmannii]
MEYIEKAIEEIKNDWFADHVAEIKGGEGLQVIQWGKPGTNMYRTKYVLSGANVFISGDIGEAVYRLTCLATLENIKGFNLIYFTGKLTAFCDDRWDFDDKKAKKELKELWEEWEMNDQEDGKEMYRKIVSAINESSSMNEYQYWLYDAYHSISMDSETMSCVCDFGKRLPYRLIGYWLGLQMAIEQLEKNKPAAEVVTL